MAGSCAASVPSSNAPPGPRSPRARRSSATASASSKLPMELPMNSSEAARGQAADGREGLLVPPHHGPHLDLGELARGPLGALP